MSFRLQRSLQAIRSSTPQPSTGGNPLQFRLRNSFSTTTRASQQKPNPEAELQSQATKTENYRKAAEDIGIKMQAAPNSITSEDAAFLKSREARATGQSQPPSNSLSAEAQRLAAENEGAVKPNTSGPTDPVEKSVEDRVKNFEQVAEDVAEKLERNPESVTKEDAGAVHSREQRAFGTTRKGGIASEVHKVADENEKGR